jgi:hypothetical protein
MVREQSGVELPEGCGPLTSVVSMDGGGPRLARPGATALAHPSRVSMSLDDCRVATGARSDQDSSARGL